MGKKALAYTFGAIFLYLGVANASNSGKLISSGASGGSQLIKTLQGR